MTSGNTELVVTHVVSGDLWAGAETQVYNLCKALKASGQVAPTAVVFNEGILLNMLKGLEIPVTLANEKSLGPLAIARLIATHCRDHGSRIVHTHGFKENVLGVIGKELAGVPRSIRTVHGNPETTFSPRQPHKWLISRLDILLGRFRQQAVIAVSTQLEGKLENLFPGKVHKIFNFVDVDDIRKQWPVLKKKAGAEPRIGIVGRLVPVKRVDLFIRTIALLNQQGFTCIGIIIGSGPLEKNLRQLSEDLKISHRIDFKGFVNPSLAELRKLDVLLMTSDHEGLPMTLLEALALEIPVVAHQVGGIPEVLEDGKSGWLVGTHSEHGYASVASGLLRPDRDNDIRKRVVSGLRHVNRYFGRPANTAQYLALYCNHHL
jgi:glycosyltransferase involved in cell wall biosynthesis